MTLWVWPFLSSLLPCEARKEDHDTSCQLLLPPSGFAGLWSCGESCPCPVGVHMTLCCKVSQFPGPEQPALQTAYFLPRL